MIDTGRIAAWARKAWSLLHEWQLDFREFRARDDDPGFRDFLSWAAQFDQALTQSGWLDPGGLTRFVAENLDKDSRLPDRVVWADLPTMTPALQNLSNALHEAGCDADTWAPQPVTGSVHRVGLDDAAQELRQAVSWARRKIEDGLARRVALVVPSNAENELRLARCFDVSAPGRSETYGLADGRTVAREPAIGAALDCLGLFSQRADFQVFSRWLRSPFIGNGTESLAVRCLAEADLRGELVAQVGFVTAYRSAGLDRWLVKRVPMLCGAVDGVLGRLGTMPRYQSPTRWAGVAQAFLSDLGWPGAGSSVPGPVLDAWQRALEELSALTPVLGAIDYERVLTELRASISRARLPVRLPLEGITVLSRLEDLGLGYDAAWVVGMSDRVWPRPAQPNPLLPHALQAVQQMPFATPADAVERCRALTSRLIARVPEIVFSYPRIENEFAAEPSPLLREIDELDAGSLPELSGLYGPGAPGVALEELVDPVPPFSGITIAGGAGTLAMQARCPLRAFIDSRLSARPLESPDRGFGPRQRGILVHRALEFLFAALPGKAQLAAQSSEQLDTRIGECIDRAVRERVRRVNSSLRVYAALERDRLMPLIRELVALDLARGDFVTEGLEAKLTARIGAFEVRCRIDRIDKLASGSLAVIDYKTGSSATPADWFKSRLVEPQLPLYLEVVEAAVDAVVIGSVHSSGAVYRGLWQQPDAFPGSPYRPRLPLEWSEQQALWSTQLQELVAEYASGDGRIFLTDPTQAQGLYAPLTRVYEQVALAAQRLDGFGE